MVSVWVFTFLWLTQCLRRLGFGSLFMVVRFSRKYCIQMVNHKLTESLILLLLSSAVVLMVVQPGERNMYDQYWLSTKITEQYPD
jgi:hypothetical protein